MSNLKGATAASSGQCDTVDIKDVDGSIVAMKQLIKLKISETSAATPQPASNLAKPTVSSSSVPSAFTEGPLVSDIPTKPNTTETPHKRPPAASAPKKAAVVSATPKTFGLTISSKTVSVEPATNVGTPATISHPAAAPAKNSLVSSKKLTAQVAKASDSVTPATLVNKEAQKTTPQTSKSSAAVSPVETSSSTSILKAAVTQPVSTKTTSQAAAASTTQTATTSNPASTLSDRAMASPAAATPASATRKTASQSPASGTKAQMTSKTKQNVANQTSSAAGKSIPSTSQARSPLSQATLDLDVVRGSTIRGVVQGILDHADAQADLDMRHPADDSSCSMQTAANSHAIKATTPTAFVNAAELPINSANGSNTPTIAGAKASVAIPASTKPSVNLAAVRSQPPITVQKSSSSSITGPSVFTGSKPDATGDATTMPLTSDIAKSPMSMPVTMKNPPPPAPIIAKVFSASSIQPSAKSRDRVYSKSANHAPDAMGEQSRADIAGKSIAQTSSLGSGAVSRELYTSTKAEGEGNEHEYAKQSDELAENMDEEGDSIDEEERGDMAIDDTEYQSIEMDGGNDEPAEEAVEEDEVVEHIEEADEMVNVMEELNEPLEDTEDGDELPRVTEEEDEVIKVQKNDEQVGHSKEKDELLGEGSETASNEDVVDEEISVECNDLGDQPSVFRVDEQQLNDEEEENGNESFGEEYADESLFHSDEEADADREDDEGD